MAVVADVHTDSNSQQALEEGVGDAFPIYVLVPVEGKLTLTKGGVFSYYEFTVPLARAADRRAVAEDVAQAGAAGLDEELHWLDMLCGLVLFVVAA